MQQCVNHIKSLFLIPVLYVFDSEIASDLSSVSTDITPSRLWRYFHSQSRCRYVFRIRTERSGGAWCPKRQITRDVYEWLQVDLGRLKVISLVETQGRFGNGQVECAVPLHNKFICSAFLFVTGGQ